MEHGVNNQFLGGTNDNIHLLFGGHTFMNVQSKSSKFPM